MSTNHALETRMTIACLANRIRGAGDDATESDLSEFEGHVRGRDRRYVLPNGSKVPGLRTAVNAWASVDTDAIATQLRGV